MERTKEERINFLRYLISRDFGDHKDFYLSLSPSERQSVSDMILDHENEDELKSREIKIGGEWFTLWEIRNLRGSFDDSAASYEAATYISEKLIYLSENLSRYSAKEKLEDLRYHLVDLSRCINFLSGDL